MKPVFIIAEAGVNHNGQFDLACRLIDAVCDAGADAIKFQTFRAEDIVTRTAQKAGYQKATTGANESQYQMIKRLELSEEDHHKLLGYCHQKKIIFLSSAFDERAIEFLDSLGLETFKIPSGEITNLPYLRKIGRLRKKIVLSTGMANLKEIDDALQILISAGTPKENITVLQCNTEYPAAFEYLNLKAMVTIRDTLMVKVGYSDHSVGIEASIAAVALGAEIIEKHITLDCSMDGPDHRASLQPEALKIMVQSIRNVEKALGTGHKVPSAGELKNRLVVRKSIVASRPIKKAELFSEKNITVKRPGTGISPMRWDDLIGQPAAKSYKIDDLITE